MLQGFKECGEEMGSLAVKRMSGWSEHLLLILLFVLLVFLFTLPFSLRLHKAVISSHVDNLLNVWILSWDAHAVATDPAALFQANMNYPSPDSLAFSEHLFILAMFAAPVTWVTGNPVLAYNLVALLGFALCGYTMYLLARYLTGSKTASLAAGVFFAFVPYHFSTIVHVHVSLYFFQPLIILMLFRYFDGGSRRYLAGLGAAFLAQALLGWYQLAFSSIPIGLFLLWKALSPRRREHAGAILRAAVVLALCMLVVLPFALPYFRLHREIPEREREPAINAIAHARPRDYLRVLPQNLLYGKLGLFATGNPGEGNALFPGFLVFPLLLLAFLSVMIKRERPRGADSPRKSGTQGRDQVDKGICDDLGMIAPTRGAGSGGRVTGEERPPGASDPGLKDAGDTRDPSPALQPGAPGGPLPRPEGVANIAHDPGPGPECGAHQAGESAASGRPESGTADLAHPHAESGSETGGRATALCGAAPRRAYFAYFTVLGLTCFVLSLGPELHGVPNLPYRLLHKLPIYGFVRFPVRYHIMVLLSLAVMVAYGCSYLEGLVRDRRGRTWGTAAAVAVTVLLLLEFAVVNLPHSAVAVGDEVPRVYRDLAREEGAVVAEVPMPLVDNSVVFEDPLTLNFGTLDNTFLSALREQDATYFSTYNWKKLLNGMSGYYPIFYRRALVEMASFPSPRSLEFLRGAGVNRLVVRWDYYPPERRAEVRRELKGAGGVSLVEDYPDGLSLFRLDPLDTVPAAGLLIRLAVPGVAEPGKDLSASLLLHNPGPLPFVNLDERRQPVEATWRDGAGEVVRRESSCFYCPFFVAGEENAPAPFELEAPDAAGEYTLSVSVKGGALQGMSWEARVAVESALPVESAGELQGSLEYAGDGLSAPSKEEGEEGLNAYMDKYTISISCRSPYHDPKAAGLGSGTGFSLETATGTLAAQKREPDGKNCLLLPASYRMRTGPAEEGAPALELRAGGCISLPVVVRNGSGALWERERPGVVGGVAITALWTREGNPAWEMVQQGLLPCDLAPGQKEGFPLLLQAPFEEGEYTLTLRLNCLGISYVGDSISLRAKVNGWSPAASIHDHEDL